MRSHLRVTDDKNLGFRQGFATKGNGCSAQGRA
jgi:hypothetical protein